MKKTTWSRRRFSKAVLSAQMFLASVSIAIPVGCSSDHKGVNSTLDERTQQVLKSAMDRIIPSHGKMPAASQIGSLNYITNLFDEMPDLAPLFQKISDELNTRADLKSNKGFNALERNIQIEILAALEKDQPTLFHVLRDFTYESYYTNEQVHALIQYKHHPTVAVGPSMEPFDEKLLDRIKALDPFYIKI